MSGLQLTGEQESSSSSETGNQEIKPVAMELPLLNRDANLLKCRQLQLIKVPTKNVEGGKYDKIVPGSPARGSADQG